MSLIEVIMSFLNGQMDRPIPYQSFQVSWFHYLALAIALIATVFAVIGLKNASDLKVKRVLLGFAGLLLTFELYKQLIFSYQAGWTYQWYIFPFQFCSTPMYVALLAGLTKNKKLRQVLIDFLGTYGLFAGLAAMVYPNDVFVSTIGINIQTMVHHGSMMVLGIALLAHKVQRNVRAIIGATAVFSGLVAIAICLNYGHNTWIANGVFNMFFINPLYNNHLPVLSLIEPLVPHLVFVLIYVVGYAFIASLVLLSRVGIKALRTNNKKPPKKVLESDLQRDITFWKDERDSHITTALLYSYVIK